jgi:hypothetical protein
MGDARVIVQPEGVGFLDLSIRRLAILRRCGETGVRLWNNFAHLQHLEKKALRPYGCGATAFLGNSDT